MWVGFVPASGLFFAMNNDYLNRVLWLVVATITILLAAYWLPSLSLGGVEMRRVELLSDLFPDVEADSLLLPDSVVTPRQDSEWVDSCRQGMTCIEDFSTDGRGMKPFYEALGGMASLGRPVRIAVLGDSYIEGDIITADLRNLLQDRYGGCGVGFVPMASETAGFRRSVVHRFGGWSAYNSVGGGSYNRDYGIISGHYFKNDSAAWSLFKGQSKYCTRLDTCYRSSLLLLAPDTVRISAVVNGGRSKHSITVLPSAGIQCVTVADTIHSIRWRPTRCSSRTIFYGATMDDARGIIVDNFSLRSSPGSNLGYVHEEMLSSLDSVRHYDLVILVYGLNVATPRGSDYDYYRKAMNKAIERLKECMPGTGFLLVSIGDRDERVDGEMRTMRGVKNLVRYQHTIAAESGIAFWNLYEAMGGNGSIAAMVKAHEANLDYTHINFKGGKRIARLLFDAMEYGKEQHERRKAFIAGKEVAQ